MDTRTPVDKPEIAGERFAYDGADHKPVITPGEGWTVSYSAAEWVEIGAYTVTVELKDGYKWSDDTSAPLLINYSIYDPNAVAPVEGEPTTTLGIVYQPSRVTTTWGYRYTLVDRATAEAFTVVVVTNARQNVSWDIPALATVETLVVGGGGAGGEVVSNTKSRGGGGGAGGLVWGKYFYPIAKTVTLQVGAGGAVAGESGGNSTIEIAGEALVTAHGGGGGANGENAAKSGGSGGGGAATADKGALAGEHPGELANAGGNAAGTAAGSCAGGGGGAGGVGEVGGAAAGGAGGAGCAYAITGELRGYAAGGGGANNGAGGSAAGVVIGGGGYKSAPWEPNAVANTGSGGGGAGAGNAAGTGASGIIVLRYANLNQKFKLEENAQGELEAIPVAGLTFYLFH